MVVLGFAMILAATRCGPDPTVIACWWMMSVWLEVIWEGSRSKRWCHRLPVSRDKLTSSLQG